MLGRPLILGVLACALAACTAVPGTGPVPQASGAAAPQSSSVATAPQDAPSPPAPTGSALAAPSVPPVQPLPRGGERIFPAYRLFGYSGSPGAPGQGRLGIGDLDDRLREIEKRGKPFLGGRKLLPVMELIATTVHGVPGPEGLYRTHAKDAVIRTWLAAARRHKALLLLNIQPGAADFRDEVRYFERWLREPDVGLALDPEWAVEKGQIPGRVFGSTTAAELNGVGEFVAGVIAANHLPEKVIVYHQLRPEIVRGEQKLRQFPGVVWIKSVDGIGPPGAKVATYQRVNRSTPDFVRPGFKLFFVEDVQTGRRLMTPREVLALKPRPEYILFE